MYTAGCSVIINISSLTYCPSMYKRIFERTTLPNYFNTFCMQLIIATLLFYLTDIFDVVKLLTICITMSDLQ